MTPIVYTATIGNTDPLFQPRCVNPAWRYVAVSDNWETRNIDPAPDATVEARLQKSLSHQVFPDAKVTIWVDSSMELMVDPEVVVAAARKTGCRIVGFRHPDRCRIRDEARAVAAANRGSYEVMARQAALYREDGWDTDENPQRVLTNGGFLVRFMDDAVKRFELLWADQIANVSHRDQMSLDYCAWMTGVEIGHFDGSYLNSPLVTYYHDSWRRRTRR